MNEEKTYEQLLEENKNLKQEIEDLELDLKVADEATEKARNEIIDNQQRIMVILGYNIPRQFFVSDYDVNYKVEQEIRKVVEERNKALLKLISKEELLQFKQSEKNKRSHLDLATKSLLDFESIVKLIERFKSVETASKEEETKIEVVPVIEEVEEIPVQVESKVEMPFPTQTDEEDSTSELLKEFE